MVQFELGRFSDCLLGLRFDPCSEAIALHSIIAWGRGAAGSWIELDMIRNSAIGSDHDALLFATDPWVEFALPAEGVETIKIELRVKAVGTELVGLLIEFDKRVVGLEAELAADKDWYRNQLATHETTAKKLWNDLAKKDREIVLCRSSLEISQAMLHRVSHHPIYRILSGFRLMPPISLHKRGK